MLQRAAAWRPVLASGLLVVLVLGLTFWVVVRNQQRRYNERLTAHLLATARLVRLEVCREGWPPRPTRLAELLEPLAAEGTLAVVLTATGELLSDTSGLGLSGSDLLGSPEVRSALADDWAHRRRPLPGVGGEFEALALRLCEQDQAQGVLWLASETWDVRSAWSSLGRLAPTLAGVALVGTLLVAALMESMRARMLRRLTRTAMRLASGDLSARADIAGSDEYAALSAALNRTRRRLARQMATIDAQRATLQALLDQLDEGVVIVNLDGRIVLINPAALRLLGVGRTDDARQLVGLALEECVPQHNLQRLLRGQPPERPGGEPAAMSRQLGLCAAGDQGGSERRLVVSAGPDGRYLMARVSEIRLPAEPPGGSEPGRGRVLVLSDITELVRMIRVRSDFVANASHELRTPLAAIRAAAETLLSIDPVAEPEPARRFVETIDRHSRRLEALVADLLHLSRLEDGATRFEPQEVALGPLFDELRQQYAAGLEQRRLEWEADPAPEAGKVLVSPYLLRIVLENLIDNAIKFTEPGGRVRLAARRSADAVEIEVSDTGCGIPLPEQGRVFERFYQVQRARSGEQRGTGLGLSIVRHAVAAMGGTVSLASQPGAGTTVTVRIPRPDAG